MATENKDMQQRRDTAANWTSNNPTLKAGEIGVETDTGKKKVGDGATAWNSLPYDIGAYDASDLENTPSGNLAAATVQGALNELQTDIDTRALDADLTAHEGAFDTDHGADHDGRDHSTALGTASVGDLSDVDTTTAAPSVGDPMVWNGTVWAPDGDAFRSAVSPGAILGTTMASAYAGSSVGAIAGSNTGEIFGMSFSNGVNASAAGTIIVPAGVSTAQVGVRWTNEGATAGNVTWRAFVQRPVDGYTTATSTTDSGLVTVAAPAEGVWEATEMFGALSVTAGELLTLYLRRANSGDTLSESAGVVAITFNWAT